MSEARDPTSRPPLIKPPKFLWPPRAQPGSPVDLGPSARFDPPPRGESSVDFDPPAQEAASRSFWDDVEVVWLGRRAAPFVQRAREQGWTPDDTAAYCSRCGSSVGPHEASLGQEHPSCPSCRDRRLQWQRCIRLGEYRGLPRRAVHELKFTAWRSVGIELGRLLGAALALELDAAKVPRHEAALVPVPMTLIRRLMRGIDHTHTLARSIAHTAEVPICRMLKRKHSPSQLSVPHSERARNIRGVFRFGGQPKNWPKVLVLVDDVRTTGATLAEASRTLRGAIGAAGAPHVQIWTAVVAVAGSRRRPSVWASEGAHGAPGEG
ncbi:MAG: hypothetical protein AABZ53_06595 [Planctomycetota bacterium]